MLLSKVFQQRCGQIVGELSTITCEADVGGSLAGKSFKFHLFDHLGVERDFWVYFKVDGVGANPVTAGWYPIVVNISAGDAAAVVAQALRAALQAYAHSTHMSVVAGVDPDVTIEGRWPGNTTGIADVDTGWASIVTTTAGSAAVAENIGLAAAAGAYVVRPIPNTAIYLRKLWIALSDTAANDQTLFGALAALATGCAIRIRDHDYAAKLTLASALKTNSDMMNIGRAMLYSTTLYTLELDFVESFGGELPVSGYTDEDFCFEVNDVLTGLVALYAKVEGHYV
ncbi:MAG: hypothetical protein PHS14_10555 [Elusimicrobia bacterium]|nr:hypothetical protein [Elusimicrobiota bacterium]